jgi:DNA invertase Pin-like site-specific DNA recombinase
MHAAAYIRVSSRGQDLRLQQHTITAAAQARGDEVEFRAEKQSATTVDRPVLAQLRADVRAGRVKRVYVFRLDRLARSGIRDTLNLLHELRQAGAEVITCADGFDLAGPMAEVVIAVMSWAASMELHARRERISAARETKEARGESWGRPRRMTPAQVSRALEFRELGDSYRRIALRIKIPAATVRRELQRLAGSKSSPPKATQRPRKH